MKLLEIKTFCLGSKTRIYLIFGLEIEIGNQQVQGKNWVSKVIINKFPGVNLAKTGKKGPKLQV